MSPRLKAQMALEFLLLVSFFLLVLVIAMGYFASLQQTEMTNREYLLGREVAARIADEVHLALVSGPGYEKTINLPPTVAGSPYELRITNSDQFATAYVEISWTRGGTDLEYAFPLASRSVYGELNGLGVFPPFALDVTIPLTIKNADLTDNRVGIIVFHQD
ncbi:MAG: hypothetical protein Q7T16_02745 [Candidatus Burarchaeum sp.]|nr:hypothetical protein [Candidatus Burarchaeum sp.]MDO8339552.1 hypothetical protein [Candidatus Burarchaeum sp.]